NHDDHSISLLAGHGDGTFGPRTDWTFPPSYTIESIAVADLNADGILDLAFVSFIGNVVSIMLGTGGGSFAARQDYPTAIGTEGVSIGDLNGDQVPDLAIANYYIGPSGAAGHTVSVLLGNGDGSFGAHTEFETGLNPRSVAIADLSADGVPDLAL